MLVKILLLTVSSNLDDFGMGFAIGLKNKFPIKSIAIIASISAATMLVGLLMGDLISGYISESIANIISAIVFLIYGIYFIFQRKDKELRIELGLRSTILLGLALGINSIALGVSGGMAGYPVYLTTILAGLISFSFIWFGSRFGHRINKVIDFGHYLAGGILIFLAIIQLI